MLVTPINWPRCWQATELNQTDPDLMISADDVHFSGSSLMEKDSSNEPIGQPNMWLLYKSMNTFIYLNIFIYICIRIFWTLCVWVFCGNVLVCLGLFGIGRGNTCSSNKSRSLLGHKTIAFYCNCNCNTIKLCSNTAKQIYIGYPQIQTQQRQ